MLSGCALSADGTSLTISFNASLLGDDELQVQSWNRSQHGASAMEVKLAGDANWTFVNVSSLSTTSVTIEKLPVGDVTGVRYAWGDNPCCGDNDRSLEPCPPMSCPLLTKNSHEPAVPFEAELVAGKCSCTLPQQCDGPNSFEQ
eukprot:SAG11_NODE_1295_length_5275_cov_3.069165_4_plen_144_part_00